MQSTGNRKDDLYEASGTPGFMSFRSKLQVRMLILQELQIALRFNAYFVISKCVTILAL